jgi:hypothetical protein
MPTVPVPAAATGAVGRNRSWTVARKRDGAFRRAGRWPGRDLARISHKPIVGSPVWSPAGVVRTGFAPFFWLAPCEGEASAVPRPSVALAGRSGPATDGFRPNSAHTAPLRRSAAPRLSALRRLSAA